MAAGNSFQSLNILDSFNLKWIACDEQDEVYITGFDLAGGMIFQKSRTSPRKHGDVI